MAEHVIETGAVDVIHALSSVCWITNVHAECCKLIDMNAGQRRRALLPSHWNLKSLPSNVQDHVLLTRHYKCGGCVPRVQVCSNRVVHFCQHGPNLCQQVLDSVVHREKYGPFSFRRDQFGRFIQGEVIPLLEVTFERILSSRKCDTDRNALPWTHTRSRKMSTRSECGRSLRAF